MEEDIKHLEDIKENFEYSLEHRTSLTNEEYLNAHRKSLAIKNILNELARLQKENEELKNRLSWRISYCQELEKDLFENCSNYVIPKQIVKDKIEEIQEEGYWLFTTDRDSDKCVEILQQLLEKE